MSARKPVRWWMSEIDREHGQQVPHQAVQRVQSPVVIERIVVAQLDELEIPAPRSCRYREYARPVAHDHECVDGRERVVASVPPADQAVVVHDQE